MLGPVKVPRDRRLSHVDGPTLDLVVSLAGIGGEHVVLTTIYVLWIFLKSTLNIMLLELRS